ncbi:sugar ABC transporter permease [Microbacterium bovistercoris]|uniref:Sugar ABC transporter permease n=1 Tax=Microbacterium bovistercoris TaxID=2293570 RepID=A0A371NYE2_9MICO|nr:MULTISPECIES: sugar ABC transporter permease [Microbacterium]MVQ44084.1 ABC transporter permease subunit [Microbacterium sp. MAH-37]REJ08718.1 sugar ABC transporter permease [Microbacterium bovistercoris]
MTQATTAAQRRRAQPLPRRLWIWARGGGVTTFLFFVPLLFTFAYFAWWPILRSLVLALQKTNLVTEPTWVGLENFQRVLADPLLGTAVANTLLFAGLAMLIGFPVPVLLATFMAEMRRSRQFASVLAYLPVIIPPVVSVLLWKQFYDPSPDGLFNSVLGLFGIGPLPFLQDPNTAMLDIVIQATWAGFGQSTIIYLAALMSVPPELYEASEMDGAKVVRRFWHITLPQMRGIMLLMLLLQIIGTMQVFTEPFVMTGGGPVNRTTTVLMLIYNYAFQQGDYGKATALSLLLAVVLTIVSAVYLRLTRSWSKS